MRYVQLTTSQIEQLAQLYKTSTDHRERQRAHALLLSQRNYTVPELADLFEVHRDTITDWMDRWQDWLADSQKPLLLQDQARSGRPSTLDTDQKKASSSGLSQVHTELDKSPNGFNKLGASRSI
jgi:transposase